MSDDDERLGHLLRAIRRRAAQTQAELAQAAQVPRADVIAVEAGRASQVKLDRLRRMFAAANARLKVTAWWHGAAADRLLDERHASLVERGVVLYRRRSFDTAVEVTFSEWGERGSIDLLSGYRPTRAAVVNEVKASIGSFEETNRMLDVKARLAPRLVLERFGWRPASVSRVLIVPNDNTVRRLIGRHAETIEVLYPVRGRKFRAWLRQPEETIGAIWFVSEVRDSHTVIREPARFAPGVRHAPIGHEVGAVSRDDVAKKNLWSKMTPAPVQAPGSSPSARLQCKRPAPTGSPPPARRHGPRAREPNSDAPRPSTTLR